MEHLIIVNIGIVKKGVQSIEYGRWMSIEKVCVGWIH
jgi:hypothetical protein